MPATAAEPIHAGLERAELQAVLASQLFVRSPTLAHLLSYLCEKKLAGETGQIKEYSIALDVFDRRDSFDQDTDSIVRVQANRLRKRLAEYYRGEGATHALRIAIPIGQYVPSFERVKAPTEPQGTSVLTEGIPSAESTPPGTLFLGNRKSGILLAATIILAIVAIAGLAVRQRLQIRPVLVSSSQVTHSTPELPAGLPVGDELRIVAGATRTYVDRAGKSWNPDIYFSGGKPVRSSVQHIWRTLDSSIYRSSRQGDFHYEIPLKNGIYELRLYFAETFYGPEEIGGGGEGSRIMTVNANGKPLLNEFDVALDAGGSRTADVKVFTGISPAQDGKLHLDFSSVRGGSAMLSAIEILPGLPERQRPVRLVARDVPYYSDDSRWWGPDDYFKGGQITASDQTAADEDDPELFETERWGHFSYAIPVAPGHYVATFYFVERRFDAANRDRYGDADATPQGGRLFSVYCNGKVILRDLDLIELAGENHPLVRRVSGLEPNAQGKLLLEFVPTRSYATVSAIEVLPQTD
jgi:hypothetical protein